MKFCKDCVHVMQHPDFISEELRNSRALCSAPEAGHDPVTGMPITSCRGMRGRAWIFGGCGKGAKYFKPRSTDAGISAGHSDVIVSK